MKTGIYAMMVVLGILLFGSLGLTEPGPAPLMADDPDHDGVPTPIDQCPSENASFFDRNGDGCFDDAIGARHTEFWTKSDMPFVYYISANGAPSVTNGSDFTALQSAMSAWVAGANLDFSVSYGGTKSQTNAAAMDRINLITFEDNEYQFSNAVLAVAISTSFTIDSLDEGVQYRAGQIFDADVIFNSSKSFRTPTGGPANGYDIQSIATHEAGHLFGIAHSPIKSATMFYVLPGGRAATTLSSDDRLVFFKAYGDSTVKANGSRIAGTVENGATLDPIPGAIVFVIDAASGDTVAADYTLPDGSYTFVGLEDGSYYVSIYPLDGSSTIGYLDPRYINALVETTAVTVFVPEYWNLNESASDDPDDKDPIVIAGGSKSTGIDILTNSDTTPPEVVNITPASNASAVKIDAAVMITFSEPIDDKSLSGNFSIYDTGTNTFIDGTAVFLKDDSVIAFTPSDLYDFETDYELTLKTGLKDKFGNGLAQQYVSDFTTQQMPPLAITSLAPNKGVVGSIIVINGVGFSSVKSDNVVSFGGVSAQVVNAYRNRLIVRVPKAAETGLVTVSVGELVSNALTFTVLSAVEVAKGFETGIADLMYVPKAVMVSPNGGYAYVAGDGGAEAVVVDPGLSGYLNVSQILIPGGLEDIDATPDGKKAYGVSRSGRKLCAIDTDPSHVGLFNTVISEHSIGAEPLGIAIEPSGGRAFIPTSDGVIEIWDIRLDSETFERQIGLITPPYGDVLGKMAIDPAGEHLLCLSGSGKLLVYDLGPDTLFADISVQSDPRDVTLDPAGLYAYVSDGSGTVGVVSLTYMQKLLDVTAGGSLRGMTITPGGTFLYAVNRQLGLIDVIDLMQDSNKFRSVVATTELYPNPVDIDLSPDGYYAFSIVQNNRQLVVTTIGLGPTLKSLSPRAGPVGTKLVLAGSGFATLSGDLAVEFTGPTGPDIQYPEDTTGTALCVTVPPWAVSGPVRVRVPDPDDPNKMMLSNALYFDVLSPGVGMQTIRHVATVPSPTGWELQDALGMSPTGDFLAVGGRYGDFSVLDTDPDSPTFNQWIGHAKPADSNIVDVVIAPDGERGFMPIANDRVMVVNMNRHSNEFTKALGVITSPNFYIGHIDGLAVSPDGERLLIADRTYDVVLVADIVPGSSHENQADTAFYVPNCLEMAFHPNGRLVYTLDGDNRSVRVVDMNPASSTYLANLAQIPMPGTPAPMPVSLAFTPDGSRCLIHTVFVDGGPYVRKVINLDCSNPRSPVIDPDNEVDEDFTDSRILRETIRVSPRGDRAIVTLRGNFFVLDLAADPDTLIQKVYDLPTMGFLDVGFTPDASRLYTASSTFDSLYIYNFSEASFLMMVSGNEQSGYINQQLAAPLKVFAGIADSGFVGVPGVPITFQVTAGGGHFTDSRLTTQVVATDHNGFAEIDWTLGPVVGMQMQTVSVEALGLSGSPMQFIADAYDSPENLPLRLVQTIPPSTAPNVSVTSAVQATFSRAVAPASITQTSFQVRRTSDAALMSVNVGFADGDRKVSLIPVAALDYGTQYSVLTTSLVTDVNLGALENPGKSEFTTAAKPPLILASVSPPSGPVGTVLTLSGLGFEPTAASNTVLFNGLAVTPYAAAVNYLKIKVPLNAISGTIRVAVGSDTSNAVPFTVLVPTTAPVDEVLATVGTTSSVKSVTVTPDGALAYSVSPDGDVVIPISVDGQTTYPSIQVGDDPVAIAIHPEGTYAYVANFWSGTVSVICVDPDSANFNKVVETITVGTNPIDVAVSPDGDRIYVANTGSSSVSVIDGDNESATRHQVLAGVPINAGAKSVVVTPDGTRIYVGTIVGFAVIDAQSNAVTANVGTGAGAKSVTVTPDGALLIVITTQGTVLIVDIQPGSSSQNKVLATLQSGSGAKSVTVSPDGATLWIIPEDGDQAIVYSLSIVASVSVFDPGVLTPPPTVTLTPIDTIPTGHGPTDLAFDPSGTGTAIICNAGSNTITFLNASSVPSGLLTAQVRVTPRTLNLRSNGRWVTGRIELPPAYWPEEIDIGSVLLQNAIHADPVVREIEDADGDGIREIVLKFDRAAFQAILPQGEYVPVSITGMVRNRPFAGWDTIRTIRPVVKHPTGCVVTMGELTEITWTSPSGYKVDTVSVHWSPDDGVSWFMLAHGISDAHSLPWNVPMVEYDKCRVMVTLFSKGDILGMGMSQDPFMITVPVAVTVQAFEGALEEGAAVLRWRTSLEQNVTGFNLLRSENESEGFEPVNGRLISPQGSGGGAYEFKDETIELNRTYYYRLDEVSDRGSKVIFGPYEFIARAPFELAQNAPNPFNPVTMIRFTIPEDGYVRLAVYDAAGRRVRTLVDGHLRANFYKVEWNGTNDAGRRVSSGVYFYRIQAGSHVQSRKMLLLR